MRHDWLQVAPISAAHILKLAQLGAYNTVNFFRVDRGFVAQVTDIRGNRLVPLNKEQEVRSKTIPWQTPLYPYSLKQDCDP